MGSINVYNEKRFKMKFFQYPTTRACILFLVMYLVLFACSSDSKDGGDPVQDPVQNTPEPTTPTLDSPSGVTAMANSASSITVSWETVSGATGYHIYRSENSSGTYTDIGTSTSTSYTDNNLQPGTAYYYKVATHSSGGTGSQSIYVSATTLPNSPDSPTDVTATANSNISIIVDWTDVQGATGYYIYRSESASGTYAQIGNSAEAPYEDTGLSGNTTYYYKVAAYNNGGNSSQSSYTSATTLLLSTPTNLIATTNSTSSITVSWAVVSGATEYHVYRSTSASGNYTQVVAPTENSYTDNNLLASTIYYYKVAAYNSGGAGYQSDYVSAATLPSTPVNVMATVNSENSITVNWSVVSGATGYYIYRSTSADGTYSQVGSSETNSYSDNSLSSATAYYYKVAAYNTGGTGTQSSVVSATTTPSPPASVNAAANSTTSITVDWSAVSGANGYYVYRSTSSFGTYTHVGTSTETSYENTDLSVGTTYYYKVAAYNSGGTGAQSSSTASVATLPSAPTDLIATSSSTSSITVSWTAVYGATGYYVYRSASADGNYTQVGSSTEISYSNTGLSTGTTYYYKVAAYNSGGTGAQSGTIYTTTQLGTPTGLTATANSTSSITVSWGAVSGATGYYIYRSESISGTYTQIGSSETTLYANTGLTTGTTYYYKVAAYNSTITGSQSSYVSTATLPNEPTNVTATATSTSSITVSWTAVSGATGYYVYRSESSGGTYVQIGYSETTSYINNSGLSNGTTYYYKIAAYNSGGTGAQSGTVYTTTQLGTPTGLTAMANSTSSITISWGAVSGATGYYIYRSESSGGTYEQIGDSETTSYTNTGLTAGTAYYYKVAAYNSAITSSQSNVFSTATLPNEPTGVTATATSTSSITVIWTAVSGATGYYIYRSTSADGTYTQVGNATGTSYTNSSISGGTTYYYKVAAYNSGGTSSQSSYVYATTQLSTPTGLTATTNSASSITVSWTAVSGATGYYIYRSENSSGTYTEIEISATNSYTDNSLSNNTTYYYKVAAYTSAITGSQSSYVYAKTSYASVSYGGYTYKAVKIGEQIWMTENLNYNVSGSRCYGDNTGGDSQNNCSTYGRLYDWATAMNLSSTCNSTICSGQVQTKHHGICPSGWHIPNNAEWDQLYRYVDGDNGNSSPYTSSTAGMYLKAISGWDNNGQGDSGNGTDNYGFAAMPGGDGYSDGSFYGVGNRGYWWSASESNANGAYSRYMYSYEASYGSTGAEYRNNYKSTLFSVRCIMD